MRCLLTRLCAVAVCVLATLFISAKEQVLDAFQGILPVTDPSMRRSLNGRWQLKVVEGISEETIVPQTDSTWGVIPVPGCWEAFGFCQPSYDKARALTGYYRTTFAVPKAWRGMRIVLRFDGVLYGYDLWINGHAVGSWRSAYNTALFDITDFIDGKVARQQLAMRVITQFRGSDFDYNDDWAPCGIFRDVTLMAVPSTHLSDLTIRTRNTGEVMVETIIANQTTGTEVRHEILDQQGRVVGTDRVQNPHLWTAETPYLYSLRTTLSRHGRVLQTFLHRFGFRELTIDGNVLRLNGAAIKLRGVTSHATDPQTVKVISDELTLRDMHLMKEASINYIRTSHYPREPRFYELADSLGFYVIDEVPFGFGDKNLNDSSFYPVLQQRAQATIRRDKNHPCVLIWSLGNENPLTEICIKLGHYVKDELDTDRPICYPQVGSYFRRFDYEFPKVADIYTPHYPSTGQIGGFYARADRPVIFTEYCHTLGVSFEDHNRQWDQIERTSCIAGGSVWEWVDQGMPFKTNQPIDGFGYEERVFTQADSGFEMYGNKGTDGLLYADRTPLPNYYELQRNYARALVTDTLLTIQGTDLCLHVQNRYDFINLKDNVILNWSLTADRDTLARGSFSPYCPPHEQVAYLLHLPVIPDSGHITLLCVDLADTDDHVFLRQSIPVKPLNVPAVERAVFQCDVAQRVLDGLTVATSTPMSMVQEGPLVRAGRKATMAERLKVADKRLERYLLRVDPDSHRAGNIATDIRITSAGPATHVCFSLLPDSSEAFLSELGIAFLLDSNIDRVQWVGMGPMPTYPGRNQAGRYGFWAKRLDDLYLEGNRQGVDVAMLTNAEGDGVLLVCRQANVSFEQTDRGLVLTYNVAVAGQGPKFARTAFPVIAEQVGRVEGEFYLYRVEARRMPLVIKQLFVNPATIPPPFHPYLTQYDTYLMRYDDIVE